MRKKLFEKYLKNECTSEELEEVIAWIKSGKRSDEVDKSVLLEWIRSANTGETGYEGKLNLLLDKIHHRINIEKDNSLRINESRRKSFIGWMTRVAALLLLPVSLFLLYTLSQNRTILSSSSLDSRENVALEIVAPVGSQTNFTLSDGSKVFLNNGSKLKYPIHFSKEKREVYLSGEGYFVVAHNKKSPFVVKTHYLNVTALGTEFNVHAYPDEHMISTTLVEGKVSIEKVPSDGLETYVGEMIPNQHLVYDVTKNKCTNIFGETEKYISWREGKLIFKNDNIDQIINRLSRWYNVEFVINDERVKELTYTATFIDETLVQILDLMELATPITYAMEPRRKLADGTFSKQKIKIGYKNK